ncbi:MAG TPA: hypothetical protein DIT09_12220 [Glutamicibacter sp.]|uniref:Uncharacterized protein n=1 Tax=Glutamicibacter arilaitensis TaxID=256701 RepID=A0A2N7S0Y1_9MICC|nr:hypothetical protein CIK84_14340 [Glutamicibacter arilaitensis]HCJ54029.1 hypothetical protein [Glutamicibacter sp.]HCM95371.1 hypothetical protein [Glutamicibacter sp.]
MTLRGWNAAQPFLGEFFAELRETVVPGCVSGECPFDERSSFLIYFDAAHFSAEFVSVQGVEVSERCTHRGSPGGRFLDEALHDLVGEVD